MSDEPEDGSWAETRSDRPEYERERPRFSLTGRVTAAFFAVLLVVAAMAAGLSLLPLGPLEIGLLTLLVGLPLGAWVLSRVLRPLGITLAGLSDGIRSFSDRDFSLRLSSGRRDELGLLARLYNRVGETLLLERKAIRERELLLQVALNQSPAAIVLINPTGRILYSNREARRLMTGGSKLEGLSFEEIRKGCPEAMRDILASKSDGIFVVQTEGEPETYHLSQRSFQLNRRPHTLLLLRRMTGELGRQEAEIWKKVLRVISHELNNSLAPISSLAHSAKIIANDPTKADRAPEIFDTIQERIDHLTGFIEGYARFARLPEPRKRAVDWEELLAGIGEYPHVTLEGALPTTPGFMDPAQMQQVVINLFKNAEEASDGNPRIALRIDASAAGTYLQVRDQGRGMDEETMRKALLPFYSTKKSGSGLGLPLCREIMEAHGGKLSLQAHEAGGTVVTCWLPPES